MTATLLYKPHLQKEKKKKEKANENALHDLCCLYDQPVHKIQALLYNDTNRFQVYCLVLACVKQIFQWKQRAELYSSAYKC